MTRLLSRGGAGLSLFAALGFLAAGCGDPKPKTAAKGKETGKEVAAKDSKGHDHSGWWCNEHGIPELECSMCQDKVAKECKAKGDWCDKHDRAKSQCFICDPSLKAKFANIYRAKYGKEPPPTDDEEKAKDADKGKKAGT